MKKRNKLTSKNCRGGFSMVEIIISMTIIAVLGFLVAGKMGNTVNKAKEIVRDKNIATVNHIIEDVVGMGGSVGEGPSNGIDTTDVASIFGSLTKDTPLEVMGVTYELDKTPDDLTVFSVDKTQTPARLAKS